MSVNVSITIYVKKPEVWYVKQEPIDAVEQLFYSNHYSWSETLVNI